MMYFTDNQHCLEHSFFKEYGRAVNNDYFLIASSADYFLKLSVNSVVYKMSNSSENPHQVYMF